MQHLLLWEVTTSCPVCAAPQAFSHVVGLIEAVVATATPPTDSVGCESVCAVLKLHHMSLCFLFAAHTYY